MHLWSWRDNHTTLLVNIALRYVLITKTIETSGDIDNKLPEFNDGTLRINPNYGMRMASDSCWDTKEWPAGTDADKPYPAIDLRGMDKVQARFITLMLGAWKSRSNLRLDFELPKLADKIYFPATVSDQKLDILTPPTSGIAWSAILSYVSINRLYEHFSVALHIVTSLKYQMVPVTADGQIWLTYDWRVSLPSFSSIRGRFAFLNEGEAAYGSRRALNEWPYITYGLEAIHLMAMVFVQAIQTGHCPFSKKKFYTPFNMMSAAAAEAIRSPVPLSGMHGVFVEIQHDFDSFNGDRRIPTLNDKDDEIGTVPTLLLPLNPFTYNSPFTLKGKLSKEMCGYEFRDFRVGAHDAWLLTTVLSLAGYEIKSRQCFEPCQSKDYQYIDMAKMTWPVLHIPHDVGYRVVLSEQEEVADMKDRMITLPRIDGKFFDQQVPYETTILGRGERGISSSVTNARKLEVKEIPGMKLVSYLAFSELHYNAGEWAKAVRGFITREDHDFLLMGNS
ncbi:hypothetical protein LXL04_025557 [Taraxacum kok-saghyz]